MSKTRLKQASGLLAERDRIQALITQGRQAVTTAEAAVATALEQVGAVEADSAIAGDGAGDDGKARQAWAEAKEAVEVAAARKRGLEQKLGDNLAALAGVEDSLTAEISTAEGKVVSELSAQYTKAAETFRKTVLQLAAAAHVCRRSALGDWLGRTNIPNLDTGFNSCEVSSWPADPGAAKLERELKPARELLSAIEKLTSDAAFERKQGERAAAEKARQAKPKRPTAHVYPEAFDWPATPAAVPPASEVQAQIGRRGMVFDARPRTE